jgi:hypothetical protein
MITAVMTSRIAATLPTTMPDTTNAFPRRDGEPGVSMLLNITSSDGDVLSEGVAVTLDDAEPLEGVVREFEVVALLLAGASNDAVSLDNTDPDAVSPRASEREALADDDLDGGLLAVAGRVCDLDADCVIEDDSLILFVIEGVEGIDREGLDDKRFVGVTCIDALDSLCVPVTDGVGVGVVPNEGDCDHVVVSDAVINRRGRIASSSLPTKSSNVES